MFKYFDTNILKYHLHEMIYLKISLNTYNLKILLILWIKSPFNTLQTLVNQRSGYDAWWDS